MKEFNIFVFALIVVIHSTSGAEVIQFSPPSSTVAKTEETFSVLCRLNTSNDEITYEWFDKDGNAIVELSSSEHMYIRAGYPGLRLHFLSINDDDAGMYKCKASVGDTELEDSFFLVVMASVKFDENCKAEQKGVLGREGAIGCSASAGGTTTRVQWDKDSKPIDVKAEPNYSTNGTHLIITNVSMENEGTYVVMAYTPQETKRRNIMFHVIIAPEIVEPISAETAIDGQKTSLYCRASGRPLPKIYWFKEGVVNPLENSKRITVNENPDGDTVQGVLEFSEVQKDDEAKYTCKAQNDGDSVTTSNQLIVQMPPKIAEMPEVLGTEGSPVEISCEARGDPIPDMMFTQEGHDKQYRPGTSADGITVTSQTLDEPSNPGAILKLSFAALNHQHAGIWTCEAANAAATDTKDVSLDVRFAPNFDNQDAGPFYNWASNMDGHLPCTANSNPAAVFTWFKGDKEIEATDQFYDVVREEDPDDPLTVTSKLMVTYNGLNADVVFGDYKCVAKNAIGQNQQNLTMIEGAVPPQPTVSVDHQTATYIKVHLFEPAVDGPPVEFFKVTYKQQGSNADPIEKTVPKEHRDNIDPSRRYTKVDIHNLEASTNYAFSFYAINPVGQGSPKEQVITTPKKSVPGKVEILSEANSKHSSIINLQWKEPDDGGAAILFYRVLYRRVAIKNPNGTNQAYEVQSFLSAEQTLTNIKDTQVRINGLIQGSYYQVKVIAINSEGGGNPGMKYIKTKEAPFAPGASTGSDGGLSTGAIIGIVVVIFVILLIVTDVTCYFKNNCGLLMSIKEKVGGRRGDEGYSAAKTDDVENLAKKDELTEEAKAAEEGDMAADDEKKAPLLSGEQKVDTVDEVDTPPEKKELEPEDKDKEVIKEETKPVEVQPTEDTKPEAPTEPPASAPEPAEQPAPAETTDKPAE